MNRKTLRGLIGAILFVAVGVTTASAAKVVDVSASLHNFSTAAMAENLQYGSTNETEVCIFCHTPHNASVGNERPLWNRTDPTSTWVFYNSATLTPAARPGAVGTVKPASLMCLSCHDGSIGVNRVINESNITGPIELVGDPADVYVWPAGFMEPWVPGPRIGAAPDSVDAFADTGKLYDDHPISFSYAAAQGADLGLHPIGDAKLAGLVFYPRNGSADHIECGTCHDPHVAYDNSGALGALTNASANPNYAPFLRISNTGSTMCLTCHNK
ncbi:MAG: hypothetical protein K0A93_02465 [Desulfuromonadaceae bacterium]|nr:hypothetical protein [Desulfuromonadaceae bacterium]